MAFALTSCSNGAEVSSVPSREQLVAAYLDAGYSDSVAECVVGLAERQFGLEAVGNPTVALLAEEATTDPIALALGEILASCQEAEALTNPGSADAEPTELAFSNEPSSYGDDPALDALWDACAAGSGAACDALWASAPIGSEYERFGVTCGDRFDVLDCAKEMDVPEEVDSDDSAEDE